MTAERKKPLYASTFVADYLRPAAKKAGTHIEDGQRFGPHNLRHSLSNCLVNKAKVEPKTVQESCVTAKYKQRSICTRRKTAMKLGRRRANLSLLFNAGPAGKSVGILGQGFENTTAVSFNGTPANFRVISNTFLKAIVPSGATTGFVTVTTSTNEFKSNRPFAVRTNP
jgi:hypothetical protein